MKEISLVLPDFGINITMLYQHCGYDWYPTFVYIFETILRAPAPTRDEMLGCGTGIMGFGYEYECSWAINIREKVETSLVR